MKNNKCIFIANLFKQRIDKSVFSFFCSKRIIWENYDDRCLNQERTIIVQYCKSLIFIPVDELFNTKVVYLYFSCSRLG